MLIDQTKGSCRDQILRKNQVHLEMLTKYTHLRDATFKGFERNQGKHSAFFSVHPQLLTLGWQHPPDLLHTSESSCRLHPNSWSLSGV